MKVTKKLIVAAIVACSLSAPAMAAKSCPKGTTQEEKDRCYGRIIDHDTDFLVRRIQVANA